ncbi:MAG: hypothetical protein HY925_14110, partial [Elusimicrobia bacterium]|nr:hypothetical protein [Elusimicrobiota bacterium]
MTPALLLAAALALPSWADPVALPPGVALVLPREANLEAGWTLPPSTAAPAEIETSFAVAPDGALWLVLDRQVVSVPERNASFAADRPFQQLLWIEGKPVVRSHEALGTFVA